MDYLYDPVVKLGVFATASNPTQRGPATQRDTPTPSLCSLPLVFWGGSSNCAAAGDSYQAAEPEVTNPTQKNILFQWAHFMQPIPSAAHDAWLDPKGIPHQYPINPSGEWSSSAGSAQEESRLGPSSALCNREVKAWRFTETIPVIKEL